ncbi:MAG: hypothetical protein KGJ66_15185 [Alphaproteobacteria bacterium]|nr:hypothetical protein [Alphaproteobacteria bacterium]
MNAFTGFRPNRTDIAVASVRPIERLILPMAQNGRTVERLLAVTVLDPKA